MFFLQKNPEKQRATLNFKDERGKRDNYFPENI